MGSALDSQVVAYVDDCMGNIEGDNQVVAQLVLHSQPEHNQARQP